MNEKLKPCSLCLECLEMISDMVFTFQRYLKEQDSYLKTNIDNLKAIVNTTEKLYLQNSELNKGIVLELNKIMSKYYKLKLSLQQENNHE